jgi:hypothetical protein
VKFEEFSEIFTFLYGQHKVREEFIDSIPRSIRDVFFDNEYATSYQLENNFLMEKLLPKSLIEDINFFLYEEGSVGDVKVSDMSLDEILDMLKVDHPWE